MPVIDVTANKVSNRSKKKKSADFKPSLLFFFHAHIHLSGYANFDPVKVYPHKICRHQIMNDRSFEKYK